MMKHLTELEDNWDRGLTERFKNRFAVNTELSNETDRGCALMATSFLDYELELLLRKKLVGNKKFLDTLFDFNGPLGSFSARIKMSYSIGLISKEIMRDIDIIRKIRNDFGHKYEPLSFENEPIKSQILTLKHTFYKGEKDKSRAMFINSVSSILTIIHTAFYQNNSLKEKDQTSHTKEFAEMVLEMAKELSKRSKENPK